MAARISLCASLFLIYAGGIGAQTPLTLSGCEEQAAVVVDVRTGKELMQHNGRQKLTPASTTKLFSTAAALLQMGPSARLRTDVTLDADSGIVTIHGVFDPTMDSKYFSQSILAKAADTLAHRLLALKKNKITLVADDSRGLETPFCGNRLWEDMGNYYGAAPSCLMADDNTVEVFFRSPNEIGAHCRVDSIRPKMPNGLIPQSFVTTHAGNSDLCYLHVAYAPKEMPTGNTVWYATGQIPNGRGKFCVKSAMPNPVSYALAKISNLLRKRGIDVTKTEVRVRPPMPKERTICSIWSPTIAEIAKETNHKSINIFADALMLNLAIGKNRMTWNDAVDNLKSFWHKKIGADMCILDGSGVSPMTAISPHEMTQMLLTMADNKSFRNSLPVAGESGTLKGFGAQSAIRGRVAAKSGTMTRGISYAGYMTCASGREVAFCIIVNNYSETNAEIKSKIVVWLEKIYRNN